MATHLLLRSVAVLAATLCSAGQVAQAAADIGSASVTIDNLRYRLVDLAPDDGIAPSISFDGIWAASSTRSLPVTPSTRGGQGLPYQDAATTAAQAGGLLPQAGLQHTQNGWGGGVSLGSGTLAVQSVLPSDRFTAARNQTVNDSAAGSIYLGGNQWRDDFIRAENQTLLGWGKSTNGLSLDSGRPINPWNPVLPSADFTLSANTMLVIEGTVSSHMKIDRSIQEQTRAQWLSDMEALGETPPSFETYGYADVQLNAMLSVSEMGGTDDQMFNYQNRLSFKDKGFVVVDEGGLGFHYDDALTAERASQNELQIAFSNETSSNRKGHLAFDAYATVEQDVQGRAYGHSTYSVTRYGPPPYVPTPEVPEPGAALLAAAGVAMSCLLTRRKASLRNAEKV